MHLEKFYVDVVTSDGSGCIGYSARFKGLGLSATVASTLRWDADTSHAPIQQRTLQGIIPGVTSEGLAWFCRALSVAGTWTAKEAAGAEKRLWSDGNGAVSWQALAPRAEVTLRLGGHTIVGLGYAERLQLNLPPWRLPIDSLRWGRFVSQAQSAIWIEWEHPTTRRWLWHNGAEHSDFKIGAGEVTWPGCRVSFGESRTLRTGRLADTAFARWPRMQRWVPARIQAFNETKYRAPGTLSAPGIADTHGWVIHEHVSFK